MSRNLAGQSRLALEQIIDTALDAFVVIDEGSKVIAWTRQAELLFGWSLEEAIDRPITDLIVPPEFRQAHHEGMRRYLKTGEHAVIGKRMEITAQHKDGRIFQVELSINAAELDGRQVFSAALRDITERKALEEQYRFAFEKAPIGMAHLDVNGKFLVANCKACDILGYSIAELRRMDFRSISHRDDIEITDSHLQRLVSAKDESAAYEKRSFHKSGHIIWLKVTLSLLREPGPNQGRIIAVFDDITQAKHMHARAERLAAVIEATPDFVGFADQKGNALYMNRAGREMLGIPLESELAGASIKEKYPSWAYEVVRRGIEYAVQEGAWVGESALISASGKEIPTSQVIIAHKDQNGRLEYISTIIRDLTERYQTEQALREMDRRKDEFLAMLAHELRNPLAPIGTAAQILKLKGLERAHISHAGEVIARQVDHMTKLIDDLLDVSRVTRGVIEVEFKPVEVSSAIADAIEQTRPLIEGRHHHLVVHPSPLSVAVQGDRTRIVQMLANILNNAAKYTHVGGSIELSTGIEGSDVIISVRDNGIGIPPAALPRVFDLFAQGNRTPDRSQGGLGIGLALVKSLAQLHGGTVTVSSKGSGMGSEFVVRLPRLQGYSAIAHLSKDPDSREESGRKLRVMVVDDNVDAAQTLATIVESKGHQVAVEHHAQDALERAKVLIPEVILLDIGLPTINGYELAHRLRLLPGLADAVLIAVTGYGQNEDVQKSRNAGFNHHLLKPADTNKLFSLLDSAASGLQP